MPNGRLDCAWKGFAEPPSLPERKKRKNAAFQQRKRAFPRRENFRHLRHQESQASRGGADVPRIAYAYSGWRSKRQRQRYIYVSGTSFVRQPEELAGAPVKPGQGPNTALFRIEIIKVPVAAPQDAKVVSSLACLSIRGRAR